MSLLHLKSKAGHKSKKRVGRGDGSGHGTFSGRGVKGQKARNGGNIRPGFEGGQTPYTRKLPKLKGFTNKNRIEFQIVNVGDLNIFENNDTVDVEALYTKKLISKRTQPVKLLGGNGTLEKSLKITVHKASASAIKAVEEKKGKVELLLKTPEVKKNA